MAASSGYDTHQGFDSCTVPTQTQLQDMWSATYGAWFGYYLGGAEAIASHCAAWGPALLREARAIGWGFEPIWDDLQAPTGCGPVDSHGVRHDFAKRMSINTVTAHSQGAAAGTAALSAMSAAGFGSADTVWLDIEGYDYTVSGCKPAVNAYVDGWDSVAGIDAGVYGSPTGSQVDSWSTLAHVPFAVAMADPDVPSADPNTVWGIPGVPNGHWVDDQRIHQYDYEVLYTVGVEVDCAVTWIDGGSLTGEIPDDSTEGAETNSPTAEPFCFGPSR